ncbi:MAG: Type I phosphodiesterase / nucleotide pyrophosphatase [Promethearchaeota archaeon]|nr:MAG: Type I phosphodiesterase / nucleotide pyrophosphatase [Candidatus Lokiarchaeota archaeon]
MASRLNHVILIILDDVRSAHLFKLIDKGKLPHIAKLVNGGTYSRTCITSFPSVTFPCYSNILLGAYSGYYPKAGSGIPAYHWLDRSDPPLSSKRPPKIHNYSTSRDIWKIGKHLGKNVKTIFEQGGEGNFLSSLNIIFRGSYFSPPSEFNSPDVFKTIGEAFENPTKFFDTNEAPKITVGYVPKTDSLMHGVGFDSEDYINEIRICDEHLGKLIDKLNKLGYQDEVAIGIISDHGNYKAERMYDLEPFFEKHGLIPYNPKRGTGDFDAAIGGVGTFNFKGETWHHHPTIKKLENYPVSGAAKNKINLFEILWEIPEVEFLYYPDDKNKPNQGRINLLHKDLKSGKISEGHIEYEGFGKELKTKYYYEDRDLFGYNTHQKARKLIDGKMHTIDEWLDGTYNIDFPILIDQLPRYFKNPRSCDIMISTNGSINFSYEHGETKDPHLYSHDIALKRSMRVPFIIGGSPEIENKKIDYCKTTDMVPSLLGLLGIKPDETVVGMSLF